MYEKKKILGWMALRVSSTLCNEVYIDYPFFFVGLGVAVVVYRNLRNERLFYVDIRVRKERASLFFYGSSSKNFDFTCL